ncbi:MAG: hypothetical protein CMJ70_04995 [Planctomycetaceae bacterium]|nr:hypothetical protein [Planctomycetaceae bacterium]HAA70022.1 hypothetical protein [Planctomycetaceae bacterium]
MAGKGIREKRSIIARRLEATGQNANPVRRISVSDQSNKGRCPAASGHLCSPAAEELIGQLELLVDLIQLIVQTDSMRSW